MRIKVLLSLAVISLIFLLCDIQKPCCTLIVSTSYSGWGIAGQPLGSGEFTEKFLVTRGDCFYENSSGHWLLNHKDYDRNDLIAKIEKIDDDGVEVVIEGNNKTIEYGREMKVSSTFTVCDGTNYYHSICFNN